MMKRNPTTDLLHDHYRDLYSMEKQLASALMYLSEAAKNPRLRELIAKQANRTYRRKAQMMELFRRAGIEPGADRCRTVEALIRAGEYQLGKVESPPLRDLMMASQCEQLAGHVVALYGFGARLAGQIGAVWDVECLRTLMDEEECTLEEFTRIETDLFYDAEEHEPALLD